MSNGPLSSTQQGNHDHDQEYQTEAAARVITPARAVRPRWERTEEEEH